MKRFSIVVLVLVLLGALVFAGGSKESTGGKEQKVIGYYMDAADDFYKAGFEVFETLATREGWKVLDIVGQGTAPEQIAAVENFITQGVDALIVVQNSPETTSQTLKLANAAGIPEFHLTHNPPNEPGLTGFAGYDWVLIGEMAGESAMKHNVGKLIMIEGKLGQGTASGQTEGFLKAYKGGGKDIGNLLTNVGVKGAGGKDLQVVFWGSGGWFADPAKKVMQDAITSLGPNGFDGAYVHNDEMMAGVLQAMEEAGLDPSDYWLGSSNGKEKSWKWVQEGTTTMDVNETATLEADIIYQMIKAHFAGESFKKAVYVYTTPFEVDNIDVDSLVPFFHDDYMKKRDSNAFIYDINDPIFKENLSYK
ncbi:MAG: sugar ABC transporter substrate-binding protein [Sphaerochaetaceae bacterium]